MKTTLRLGGALIALAMALPAVAAVGADEVAKLKTELTPFGAERAGNKDGSIPAWTGGLTTPIPGQEPGGRRGDPFKDEKPLFSITAKNMDQYVDRLTDGTEAMLKKYPDTFRLDVYKTHRTAAAPQWVYDNTVRNATRARIEGGHLLGAYGGIPFPIPKTGEEVMWNHVLRWVGESAHIEGNWYVLQPDGRNVLISDTTTDMQNPYYYKEGSGDEFEKGSGTYWQLRNVNVGPPIKVGEAILTHQSTTNEKSQTWVYLTGQRRVRMLPNACCDTPTPAAAGLMTLDETYTFAGRNDRFDWKLVGKKEMYIPYNTNKSMQPKTDAEVLGKSHLNPDHVRWELHRVWVVEANVRAGQRHQTPKGRYYCDEDTWICVLGDRWDANGQLWRMVWTHVFVAPELPGVVPGTIGFNDLISGTAVVGPVMNSKTGQHVWRPPKPESHFSPDALTGDSLR